MNLEPNVEIDAMSYRVSGDLVSTNANAIQNEINALLDKSDHPGNLFRLDLSAATMIDSVGLNLVVALFKRVRKTGAKLQVLYSSQNVLRTFTFTRLDTHIQLKKV
jgi:anti-anti-sigma factor